MLIKRIRRFPQGAFFTRTREQFEEIRSPDVHHGRKNADFGQGFYMSPDRSFSERWAKELGFSVSVVESRENKIHFYETMGYVADYSKKIVGDTFTCYRMTKNL